LVGYGGKTVNTLRLWTASAAHSFDFQRFSEGDFVASMADSLGAESLTRVLYPDDTTPQGRALRAIRGSDGYGGELSCRGFYPELAQRVLGLRRLRGVGQGAAPRSAAGERP
jgi:hypothetical protein